jgi:3',5'-cyclic-AMP phosphodiesterase
MPRTIAHLSDLHLGRDARTDAASALLVRELARPEIDAILLTGDVTHRGRRDELAAFERMFAPIRSRLVMVPGNHDRLGDDAGSALMRERVEIDARPGLFVIRLDSTAPHNRHLIRSHGELTRGDISAIVRALQAAPAGSLVVLMLHHHLLPLPEDHLGERLATLLGWPHATELELGRELVGRLGGRCDLVLHGHRHRASELTIAQGEGRPLHVLNAGSSPQLGRVRLITHHAGDLLEMRWLEVDGTREGSRGSAAGTRADGTVAAA